MTDGWIGIVVVGVLWLGCLTVFVINAVTKLDRRIRYEEDMRKAAHDHSFENQPKRRIVKGK